MNWFIFERLSTQIGIVGVIGMLSVMGSGGTQETQAVETLIGKIPPEAYIVGWMGVVTLLIIRFVIRFGKHVPRTPNGELSRYKEAQDKKFAEYKAQNSKKYDDLHTKVDRACEDMAAIKRDIELLVIGNGEDK